ncbi:MAG: hypothetical protein PWP37_631 [Thermotogota bacterium]|nr:hypothetical protein [Thermotogota bacterium]
MKEISGDLISYLKSGYLSINSFLNNVNLEIESIDELLKIHFLLLEDVRRYILCLPNLIRRLRVSTEVIEEIDHQEIRGHINWQNTIRERLKRNNINKTLYCQVAKNKYYNTKKNVVLKSFVEEVYRIITELKMNRFVKYDWFKNGSEIVDIITNIYEKNVYLNRIHLKKEKITSRMIENVTRDRNVLYSEAAKLLKKYRRIINFDFAGIDIKSFFENTFIELADDNTLFELYWIVKILKSNAENYKMHLIDGKNNKIASFEDETKVVSIYHNSTGTSELNFNIKIKEIENLTGKSEYVTRLINVSRDFYNISSTLFHNKSFDSNTIWNGRPDILIEVRDKLTGTLEKIIIGEVKYTIDENYMLEGLKQLLEYMHYLKDANNEYIYKNKNIEIEGILFVDNIKLNKSTFREKNVRIYNKSNNEEIKLWI